MSVNESEAVDRLVRLEWHLIYCSAKSANWWHIWYINNTLDYLNHFLHTLSRCSPSLPLTTVVPYMQTAWIWMRPRVTRRLIQIQAVLHSDNIFTRFRRPWNTFWTSLKCQTFYSIVDNRAFTPQVAVKKSPFKKKPLKKIPVNPTPLI